MTTESHNLSTMISAGLARSARPLMVQTAVISMASLLVVFDASGQTSDSQLLDRAKQFGAVLKARDAATLAGFYTDDAVAVAADGQVAKGRPAIEAFFRQLLKDPSVSVTGTPVRFEVSGDIGYVFGDLSASGSTFQTKGHYVEVWKKTNGEWKIAYDLATATSAPAATSR